MTDVHRIADLASPQLPRPLWLLNRVLAPFTQWVRLDEAELLSAAMKKTGLTNFGDDRFREPLHILLQALARESELNTLSRVYMRQFLQQLLVTRLLVQDLVTRHPEILALPVPAPIVILGLPRTGTTLLHNVLARDPRLRSLPYWESLEPVLLPTKGTSSHQPDLRMKRCQQRIRQMNSVMPLYPLMHEMACDLPQEEIQLLAVDFSTMLFEWNSRVPSYRDWYRMHDQAPSYHYLRKLLQVLQWLRGGTRWVLKSPQHLEQIGPLLEVFPDAKIVQTHRDPVAVTASLCTMLAYVARTHTERVNLLEIGRYWSDRVEDLLRASVRDRSLIPDQQILDIQFHEFMADEIAMVRQVYTFANLPLTEQTLSEMKSFLAENPRGKLGRIEYHLEDFGLNIDERRAALRFYTESFAIPDE